MPTEFVGRSLGSLCLMICLSASAAESCPLPRTSIKTENAAVERAIKAVEIYKIGRLKPQCMALVATRQKTGYLVDIRELHNEACGGDPMTEPRAFSIDIAWNGNMKSDAYDHLNYLPLTCPKT